MPQKTSNMRILSICNISPTKFGSFEEFLVSLTEKLRERRLTHIIIFRDEPIKIVKDALIEKGAELKVFKPSNFSICNLIPLYNIIKETKPSVVHFHFYPIYTVINYLNFFLKSKMVYTDHMGYKKTDFLFKKIARRIYYYTSSKLFDFGINNIICVSNFVKDKYHMEYGIDSKNLHVIYNGVNTERFKKKCNIEKIKKLYNITDEFVVTCVSLRKEKGVQCLIDASPTIIKVFPKTRFILVGEDKSKSYLEEYVNKLDIKSHFIFTGNTDNIEEIYSISSCVVIPTLANEAFCFVAAEAMSTETPVVAFDSGALKEIINNKSNIISKSSNALSCKIIECLRNEDIFTKNSREHVIRNFSLDRSTYNYIEMYEKLIR